MRAMETSANNISPSRATATAECSSWVLAGKRPQLLGGLRAAGRLAEQSLAKRQRLIRAHHELTGMARRNRDRLLARQQGCDFAGRRSDRKQVESRAHRCSAGIASKAMPALARSACRAAALRRQDQRFRSAPDRHSRSRWRCRSANSFITAAAVSSIERRVTSSSAQLYFTLRRRANATSSVTDWRSI